MPRIQMLDSNQRDEASAKKDEAVIDPVCGMTVHPDSAAGSYEYQDKTYYFCSRHCLEKFRKDPESFLARPQATMTKLVGIQRAKSKPEENNQIPSSPGSDPASDTGPGSLDSVYTCPMHPEVVRQAPG